MDKKSKLKSPCTKCGKLISEGWGNYLRGQFFCQQCMDNNPGLQELLSPEGQKQFKERARKRKE